MKDHFYPHSGCICLLLFIFMVTPSIRADALKPLKGGERICFIGNSYTGFYGPLPDAINAVMKSVDPLRKPFHWVLCGKGCAILKDFVVDATPGALDSIGHGNWDYVVLQSWEDAVDQYDIGGCGTPKGYPRNQDTLIKYYKILDDRIKAVNGKTILYAPHFNTSFYDQLKLGEECFARLRREASVPYFTPIYYAWDQVLTEDPPSQWGCSGNGAIKVLFSDCGHQNANGMALDAFTWFTVLTGGMSAEGSNPRFPDMMGDTTKRDYFARVGCTAGRKILAGMGFPDDFEAPSRPAGLQITAKTQNSLTLSWQPSTDNKGVTGYEVFLDGLSRGSTTSTSLTVSGVDFANDQNITVRALDAAGHYSLSSLPVSTGTTLKYEAENSYYSSKDMAGFWNDRPDYSGTGFIAMLSQGAGISFTVEESVAGTRQVALRYLNSKNREASLSIYVNGSRVKKTTLPRPSSTWGNVVEDLTLKAGKNSVEYVWDSSADGDGVTVDRITVYESSATSAGSVLPRLTENIGLSSCKVSFVRSPNSGSAGSCIVVSTTTARDMRVTLTSAGGRRLVSLSLRAGEGSTVIPVKQSMFAEGLVLVTIESGNERTTGIMPLISR